MATARAVVVDEFSYLSHKPLVGHPVQDPGVGAPTWCPRSERRRVRAQLARGAYLANVARDLLPADTDDADRRNYTEYGDPATFVRRIVAAVLGDDWTWIVDGADDDLPDEPDLPPEPGDLPADATDVQRRIHATRLTRWADQVDAIVDQWEADLAAQPALATRQAEFRAWADRASIALAVHRAETDTVGIGQSVIVLWQQEGDWPRPEVIPSVGVFPVRDEHDDGRFPRKYHLAWEYDHDTYQAGTLVTERRLRRITFELVDIASTRSAAGQWVDPATGEPVEGAMIRGDEKLVTDDDGTAHIVRVYPWDRPAPGDEATGADGKPKPPRALTETAEDREPSRTVCLYSDGTWPMEGVGSDVNALDESKAMWRPYGTGLAYRADYGIDFLPIIDTEGLAIIDVIAQVLDDLAEADTAAASASRYIKHPTIAATGVTATGIVAPGMAYGLPEGGRMDVLDLSGGLEQMRAYVEFLLDRATSNAGIPADLLGRSSDDGGPESGLSRLIRWAPFAQLVGEQRMTRKWDLLAKMAQRMAQTQGRWEGEGRGRRWVPVLPPGPTPTVRLAFGSFLPTDRSQTLKDVAEGVRAHVLSLQTAVSMLVAAGFPVDDARAEVERIRADDVEGADRMADALAGHPDALALVADRLGVAPPPGPGEPPTVDLPEQP